MSNLRSENKQIEIKLKVLNIAENQILSLGLNLESTFFYGSISVLINYS